MTGAEIMSFVQNNISTFFSPVNAIAGAVISAIFLRRDTATQTATQEFEKIKAGKLKEAADELLASGKMTYTEYYKMNNFLDIAKKADEIHEELPKKEQAEPYNFDWFMRFFEATGTVSDEEMQELWAKILAGEIYNQGSYSLRTLESLKNLSKSEAVLFQKVCQHSLEINGKIFLPHYDEYTEAVSIRYEDLMKLGECGLINSDGSIILQMKFGNGSQVLYHNSRLAINVQAKPEGKKDIFTINQYPFTNVGHELSHVIATQISDDDVLRFAQILKQKQEKNFSVSARRVIWQSGTQIVTAPMNSRQVAHMS